MGKLAEYLKLHGWTRDDDPEPPGLCGDHAGNIGFADCANSARWVHRSERVRCCAVHARRLTGHWLRAGDT